MICRLLARCVFPVSDQNFSINTSGCHRVPPHRSCACCHLHWLGVFFIKICKPGIVSSPPSNMFLPNCSSFLHSMRDCHTIWRRKRIHMTTFPKELIAILGTPHPSPIRYPPVSSNMALEGFVSGKTRTKYDGFASHGAETNSDLAPRD